MTSHTYRRAAAAVMALAGLFALGGAASAGTGTNQVDMKISKGQGFVGDNVYNTTAVDQTVRYHKAKQGQTLIFDLSLQNDAGGGGGLLYALAGCDGTKKFRVKYVDAVVGNITDEVTAGGTAIGPLTPGQEYADIDLRIKPTKKAKPGNSFTCGVSGQALDPPNDQDVVAGVVTMKP
jgi:hypothetical protein